VHVVAIFGLQRRPAAVLAHYLLDGLKITALTAMSFDHSLVFVDPEAISSPTVWTRAVVLPTDFFKPVLSDNKR
jgi:hypothetical protein